MAAALCLALAACLRPAPPTEPLASRGEQLTAQSEPHARVSPEAPAAPPPGLPSPSHAAPVSAGSTASPTLPPTRTAAESPTSSRPLYTIKVRFDYIAHLLEVSQSIRFSNPSAEEWHSLLLRVPPNRRAGVFSLESVQREPGLPVEPVKLEGEMFWLALEPPLQPGQETALDLEYALEIPAWFGFLGYSARQTNLGDWYPYLPPYRSGEGWLAPEPAALGEYLAFEAADFNVEILPANPSQPLTLAAGAVAQPIQGGYAYRLERARSFAWSAGLEYRHLAASAGPVTLQAYIFPEHQQQGLAALEAARQAVLLFSELFGPYPHPNLSLVEAAFFDGMEYDGLFFLGEEYFQSHPGSPRGYLTALTVHETAHQWWYSQVGSDPAHEPWLDEALASYSELLFYEAYYPDLVDWWWDFRVKRFEPQGWVDSTIYDLPNFRAYVNAVYLRGALFLSDLRSLVGDEVFFAFLQDYAARGEGRIASSSTFFEVLSDHTSADLSALQARYFQEAGQP